MRRMKDDLRMSILMEMGPKTLNNTFLCVKKYVLLRRSKTRMCRELSWLLHLDIEH